jgi:hypothetical protein
MNTKLKEKLKNIINSTIHESEVIIERIPQQYIDIYCIIQERYEALREKIAKDSLFKFLFRSYYMTRINFKQSEKFFKLLANFQLDDSDDFDRKVHEVLSRLQMRTYRATGIQMIEYSYGSKLLHTINNTYPIYDSRVHSALSLPSIYAQSVNGEKKIKRFLSIYHTINEYYENIIENNLLDVVITQLEASKDTSKLNYKTNPVKLLDFIFWAKGKK